jgi:hypothetical protein
MNLVSDSVSSHALPHPESGRSVVRSAQKWRFGFAFLSVVICAFAFASIPSVAKPIASQPVASVPALLSFDRDGFRYEYHVPSGREWLYMPAHDASGLTNVIGEHEEVAVVCRRALGARYGVSDLGVLRARWSETIRRLQALGYL